MQTQIQALALLPKLSEQQLVQALQAGDGSLPAYAVMAELQARKKRAAGFAGHEAPKTSVKDDMMAQASGLQSLSPMAQMPPPGAGAPQQGMPPPQGMAAGGKIGYADGGSPWEHPTQPWSTDPWGRQLWRGLKQFWNPAGPGRGFVNPGDEEQDSDPSRPRFGDAASYGPGTPAPAFGSVTGGSSSTAPAQSPGGLSSISARAGSRTGATGPAAEPFKPTPIQLRSIQDAMKDLPKDTSIQDAIASLKAGDTSDKDLQNAKWEALMRTGIGMASTPGNFLTGLAHGAGQGLDSLGANRRMIQQDKQAQDREMRNLAIAQGKQGLEQYGIANQTRFGEAGIADKNADNQFNAWKAAEESNDRKLQMQTQVQVAGIHAAAAKAAQTDLRMQQLVTNTQMKAAAAFKAIASRPENMAKYMSSAAGSAAYDRDEAKYVAAQLSTIPNLDKYWTAPTGAAAPALTDKPVGKVFE
jgi:hypothetical protein